MSTSSNAERKGLWRGKRMARKTRLAFEFGAPFANKVLSLSLKTYWNGFWILEFANSLFLCFRFGRHNDEQKQEADTLSDQIPQQLREHKRLHTSRSAGRSVALLIEDTNWG